LSIDLSALAGFPMVFEPTSLNVETREVQFTPEPRYLEDMKAVLRDFRPAPTPVVHYWNFKLASAGDQTALFQQRHLTFGLVLLPPGRVGSEYIKTHGHYHSAIPGSQIGYPEVYTHYWGTLYLLLQRRQDAGGTQLDDCALYRMVPGQSITIPPGYAHVLINPSDRPALMAGLYSLDSKHNYAPIDHMTGAGYYIIDTDGQECILPNPAYTHLPPLRSLIRLDGTAFEPPDRDAPLWQSFVTDPERYAFLYDPNHAKVRFAPQDLRV